MLICSSKEGKPIFQAVPHTPPFPKAALKPQAISFDLHVHDGEQPFCQMCSVLAEVMACDFSRVPRWLLVLLLCPSQP